MPGVFAIGAIQPQIRADGASQTTAIAIVRDAAEVPVVGVEVAFAVTAGGASVTPAAAWTRSGGYATSVVTAAPSPGAATIEATAGRLAATTVVDQLVSGSLSVIAGTGTSVAVSADVPSIGGASPGPVAAPLGTDILIAVTPDDPATTPVATVDGTPVALSSPDRAGGAWRYTLHVSRDHVVRTGYYELKAGVKMLDESTMAQVASVSPDGRTLSFLGSTPQLANLAVGDVFVAPTGTAFTAGFRGRVASVADGPSGPVVTTAEPGIGEVYVRLSFDVDAPVTESVPVAVVTPSSAASPPPGTVTPAVGGSVSMAFPVDYAFTVGIDATTPHSVGIGVEASATATLRLSKPRITGCVEILVPDPCVGATISADASLEIAGKVGGTVEVERKLPKVPVGAVATPIPGVVLTLAFRPGVGIKGTGAITLAGSRWQGRFESGLTYRNGGVTGSLMPHGTWSPGVVDRGPTGSVAGYAIGELDFDVDLACGGYGQAKAPAIEVQFSRTANPWWVVKGGVVLSGGFQCSIAGWDVAQIELAKVEHWWEVARANGPYSGIWVLGTLPGGDDASSGVDPVRASAISGTTAVGYSFDASGIQRAVAWDTTTSAARVLDPLPGGGDAWAAGVSGDMAVGWALGTAAGRAVLWNTSTGAARELSPLPGGRYYPSGGDAWAYAISGTTAVGRALDGEGGHAVAWDTTTGAVRTLASLSGGDEAQALAVSGATAVGWSWDAGGASRAVAWDTATGAVRTLSPLSGGGEAEARGVSGTVAVGQALDAGGASRAVAWDTTTGAVRLLSPLAAGREATAWGISGSIAVGWAEDSGGVMRAAAWNTTTGTVRAQLNPLSGGCLAGASAVSGATAVGWSWDAAGSLRAVAWALP